MCNWVCFIHVAHAMPLIGCILAKWTMYWQSNYLMLRNEVTKANMRSEHFLTSTPLLKIWSAIMTSKVLLDQLIFWGIFIRIGSLYCYYKYKKQRNGNRFMVSHGDKRSSLFCRGPKLRTIPMEIRFLPTLFIRKEPFIWRLECHKIFIS